MIVTRFAPSPTGRLHLGHAYSALVGHDRARSAGGHFLVRIEDLDPGRSRPHFVEGIFDDLRWLGIAWDQPVLVQSDRASHYAQALDRLRAMDLVYPCFCTRSDIAEALSAPHAPPGRYPGTCRTLPDDPERRAAQAHSWRLDAAAAIARVGIPRWIENGRSFEARRDDVDDVILARKDAPASYHLACVVDDGESEVTLVTRGADLRPSTPVQIVLQTLLGLPRPDYLHHRIVAHADGRRLAKRDRAPTLAELRSTGIDGASLAADLREGKLPLGFGWLDT